MSGSAVISAVAVLENPRIDGNKGKNVLFDAHLYFYEDPNSPNHAALVLLCYFNNNDFEFGEVGHYFVQANISLMDEKISSDKLSDGMDLSDYVLVGDIVQIIPLPDDTSPDNHSFELSPEVYIALKGKGSKATLPVYCFVPDTKRWEAHKPVAKVGNYIGVSGFLHSVIRNNDGMASRFQVEIEHLTYLPRPYVPLSTASSRNSGPTAGSSTPPSKRLLFSYSDSPTPSKKQKSSEGGFDSPSQSSTSLH
ncbi:hypothetical protein BT96DRAFT_1002024 [Gymnopus androsaceus JB14]|uniref:Uncharacterized protein n=1 Tax=Gymnopus androsaceus JB14 TaxID=1447944 RepID=A0A6A4GXT4_9AGAR|nr:hypothetical protein BT96DRAFT_1002024 [Gymnopus androsaceus JB14]